MEPLSSKRSRHLAQLLHETLSTSELSPPTKDEGEVSFTSRVLCAAIRLKLDELGLSIRLSLKGDGTGKRAIPASFLDQDFYPDLSISRASQNLWAIEVKILRHSGRQNAIATAFGQASLYRSRYENVSVVFIDKVPGFLDKSNIVETSEKLGIPVIVRKVAGKTLASFQS